MEEQARRRPLLFGVMLRVFLSLVALGLFTQFVAQPYQIPSGSMEPTLRPGDQGMARVLGVDAKSVGRGEVIAFRHGGTWESDRLDEPDPLRNLVRYVGDAIGVGPSHHDYTVKRIIGLPGETVQCCDEDQGRLVVDGVPIDEPYVAYDYPFDGSSNCELGSLRCFPKILVPEDSFLVLGDNRSGSSDSVAGCRGLSHSDECTPRFVRADQVLGTVGWRWWPLPPGNALRPPPQD